MRDTPPPVLRRFAAGVIDNVLVFLLLGTVAFDFILSGSVASIIYTSIVYAMYEVIGWRAFGTTVGKWALAMKVTNKRGFNPNFSEGITRYLVRQLEPLVTVIAAVNLAHASDIAQAVMIAWGVFILITIHRAVDRRGLHDRASGCTVTWSR